jgi:hypothetical protein
LNNRWVKDQTLPIFTSDMAPTLLASRMALLRPSRIIKNNKGDCNIPYIKKYAKHEINS